ncbi:MAG TPA: hypothetical protein VNJ08_16135 [Bacteriovoracaceae bacterium]|nr:hypothetical protein [Bacteriovoracaceae bacterium]
MANIIVVYTLIALFFSMAGFAKADRFITEVHLGEKKLDSYSERYEPLIFHDVYQGKMAFEDELFFQNYFRPYNFNERDIAFFLRSELNAGLTCTNELFSEHFDEIRYSYRLITLSYLLEGQWHMKLTSDHFKLKNGCEFDLQEWAQGCNPKSDDMKKFVMRMKKFDPKYNEMLPSRFRKEDWLKDISDGKPESYSQYKMQTKCKGKCEPSEMAPKFKSICDENKQLMNLICSEQDELYGLSGYRDAYFLVGLSNIINTFNKRGEAMGCLRRFSEVMSHKEVMYPPLNQLFPVLQTYLRNKYEERFLQGRVFFYGSGKEFENKGLTDLYVKEQTLQVMTVAPFKADPLPEQKVELKAPEKKVEAVKVVEAPKKKKIVEIRQAVKSAFLQSAEIRLAQNLSAVEVDMLKLKYDYVFTLNMMNTLSERLKTFMTREALSEMMTYDKLGSIEGPVPLLFLKFMIDMHEHQGLYNIISVLGDKFFVSNEIDASFTPAHEYIQLSNNESTGNKWQIHILRR